MLSIPPAAVGQWPAVMSACQIKVRWQLGWYDLCWLCQPGVVPARAVVKPGSRYLSLIPRSALAEQARLCAEEWSSATWCSEYDSSGSEFVSVATLGYQTHEVRLSSGISQLRCCNLMH